MRTFFTGLLGAMAVATVAAPASAAVTIVNDKCVSVSDSAGCLFNGNIAAQFTAETQSVYNAARDPDISLTHLFKSDDGQGFLGTITFDDASETSGTWSTNGFLVDYLAVKAGSQFVLYSIAPASSGTWSTAGLVNGRGIKRELSHLSFFGSAVQAAVPEPTSWAMMIAGFGLIGAGMRSRRKDGAALCQA
ncbi:PEP-CTERM protein-sorting domain-containing protein [Sphingomonas laterariae]|uniref:PEP-CTERM protein-sorting domain-containing protein n=1 Tax=Edaphosphingomonas laterariae TaxID=861865 RepID=A0A239DJ16_9SPHN|nr:PEPxxWA-CTERM sorting domain-containing protein [Sphingomonas laterariae]SNS32416.1 PEP-CTERM protein-sorting domain-containing protein [Sphingomonas laterariae]